jgi:hypothetical protein
MAITPGLGFDSDRWPERPSLFWRDRRASCIFSSFPPQLSISRIESAFAVPLRLALMPLVSHKRTEFATSHLSRQRPRRLRSLYEWLLT